MGLLVLWSRQLIIQCPEILKDQTPVCVQRGLLVGFEGALRLWIIQAGRNAYGAAHIRDDVHDQVTTIFGRMS